MQIFRAIGNSQGDQFGTLGEHGNPRTMTKQEWIDQLNEWQEMDGAEHRYSIEDWEMLDDLDFRGVILEEVKEK